MCDYVMVVAVILNLSDTLHEKMQSYSPGGGRSPGMKAKMKHVILLFRQI